MSAKLPSRGSSACEALALGHRPDVTASVHKFAIKSSIQPGDFSSQVTESEGRGRGCELSVSEQHSTESSMYVRQLRLVGKNRLSDRGRRNLCMHCTVFPQCIPKPIV
jgi:hypothetical protein